MLRYVPKPPLAAFVECFWLSDRKAPLDESEHMLPSGTAQLVIALHDSPFTYRAGASLSEVSSWRRSIIHGPQSSFYIAGPKQSGTVVGVSFHAGRAAAILGVPMNELVDRHVALEYVWGNAGSLLREQLMAARDPAQIFAILERHLIARMRRPLLINPAMAEALARKALRTADIRREIGISPKHFISLFRAAVGLTPKQYERVRRFNKIAGALASSRERPNLADLAAAAGYADQSHMSREFKDFAGVSPREFHPRRPDSPLHHVATR
jgi:AraC-like DNA-binding protein